MLTGSHDLNFAYCSVPERIWDSSWDFSIFLAPFDSLAWIFLFISLTLVSAILALLVRRNIVVTLLSSLAVLLEDEMNHFKSKLYVLWLLISVLLVEIYLGKITGDVTAPSRAKAFGQLSELYQANYSLIFRDIHNIFVLQSYGNAWPYHTNTPRQIIVVRQMLRRSKFVRREGQLFIPALVKEERVAALLGWSQAIWAATTGNEYIANMYKSDHIQKIKCRVGSEFLNTGPVYFAFSPPGSTKMAGCFGRLHQSGIVNRWISEMHATLTFRRVQDRVKSVRRTSMANDVDSVATLKMNGKVSTVFVLWIVCFSLCAVVFTVERI